MTIKVTQIYECTLSREQAFALELLLDLNKSLMTTDGPYFKLGGFANELKSVLNQGVQF